MSKRCMKPIIVIESSDLRSFERYLNDAVDKGYKPHGELSTRVISYEFDQGRGSGWGPGRHTIHYYTQLMILTNQRT